MSEDPNETTQTLCLTLPVSPTVLIVDDDNLVLGRLRELVESDGYVVHTCANGVEALQALERHSPSIVVTDLNMPHIDGLELCRRIRERASPSYVYIVLLTIRDEEKDILAGFDAGADDYLSKRSSAALFTARLRTARRVLSLEFSLKDALEKKRLLAMSDALTGVYNRRYFLRHVSRAVKRAWRFGGHVSLLLLDIDDFKGINDGYGHAVGDLVLKTLTQQIARCLRRETDWCARLGGDEFVVVLEGTKLADARTCAEAVRESIASTPVDTPAGRIQYTVSIGIGALEELSQTAGVSVQSLLERADAQLYASKSQGRNRISSSNCLDWAARKAANPRANHVKPQSAIRSIR